jgi:PPOX class probable F420-dependent enzyme
MLTKIQARLLIEPNPAIVTTLRRDGSPNSTLTWIDWDGEFVIINTVVGRGKEVQLRQDNRISVCVVDRHNTNSYLGVDGHAELTTEGAREHVNALSRKYLGTDFGFKPGMERIIARFRPERVWGVPDEEAQVALRAGGAWESLEPRAQ